MEIDADQIRKRYSELMPKYQNLAVNLEQALEQFLNEAGIDYLTIYHRIKDIDSFVDKIGRKVYDDPFSQVEDICGLRIICYYNSDVDKICDVIKKELEVVESTDKGELLSTDQFGYRSAHVIVRIKPSWLSAPNYRGLENLKAEIQVRTVLMHAWAEIQHKLAYKKQTDIPTQFQRQLSIIAAKLEETDEQFEHLRVDTEEYRKRLIAKAEKAEGVFDSSLSLNLDNLEAYLDHYFPKKKKSDRSRTGQLLDELVREGITMKQLVESYEKVKAVLPKIEEEDYDGRKLGTSLYQVGMARLILDLTVDSYFKRHELPWLPEPLLPMRKPYPFLEIARKWRKRIKEK